MKSAESVWHIELRRVIGRAKDCLVWIPASSVFGEGINGCLSEDLDGCLDVYLDRLIDDCFDGVVNSVSEDGTMESFLRFSSAGEGEPSLFDILFDRHLLMSIHEARWSIEGPELFLLCFLCFCLHSLHCINYSDCHFMNMICGA